MFVHLASQDMLKNHTWCSGLTGEPLVSTVKHLGFGPFPFIPLLSDNQDDSLPGAEG